MSIIEAHELAHIIQAIHTKEVAKAMRAPVKMVTAEDIYDAHAATELANLILHFAQGTRP